MKIFIIVTGLMLFFISCINEEYDDLLSQTDFDAADDHSSDVDSLVNSDIDGNSTTPDESGNTGNTGDSADTGNTGNSGNTGNTGNTADSGNTATQQKCGNSIVETGETCDKNSILCKDLDVNFESGSAVCKEACTGWNTDDCKLKLTPLATIPAASFEIEYLYNGQSAFNTGTNQNNELWNAPLFSASIPLTNGTYYIPHDDANVHWLAGFFDSTTIQFVQQSYYVPDEYSSSFTTPYIVMGASLNDAKKDAVLSIGIKNENEVNFIVVDIMNDVDCVILVGYGTLTVNSISVTEGDAGDFTFTTSKIDLYLPKETPEGNLISEIENSGFAVCQ